jgi:hypothetical protein
MAAKEKIDWVQLILNNIKHVPAVIQTVQSVIDMKSPKPADTSEADEAIAAFVRNVDDRLNAVESENENLRNLLKNQANVLAKLQIYLYCSLGLAISTLIYAIVK